MVDIIVVFLPPEWRAVARHVNTAFRAAVGRAERSTGRASLQLRTLTARLPLLQWAAGEAGLDWHLSTCERRPPVQPATNLGHSYPQGLPPTTSGCTGGSALCAKGQCVVGWRLCALTAAEGNLSWLCWLVAAGCPWNEATTTAAAGAGHMDILQWAVREGCPLDTKAAYCAAARGGHVSVLKWLLPPSADKDVDRMACLAAVQAGHLHVLLWMESRPGGKLETGYPHYCSAAARGGHLDLLKWLRGRSCAWDQATCSAAARAGHEEVLRWAIQNGCPFDERTCSRYVPLATLEAMAPATFAFLT